MTAEKLLIIDAFADRAFSGNPAAVCLLNGDGRDAQWMQDFASEMNLSETAFLEPAGDNWKLRWFTPRIEVKLCGHATLAAAHALWDLGLVQADDEITFETASGNLPVRRANEWTEVTMPAIAVIPESASPDIAIALGTVPTAFGRAGDDLLAELPAEPDVFNIRPDMLMLERATSRGVIVTARASTEGYDFISRFFAPAVGIEEDPVTGSAHCALAPWWSERLGKDELIGYQASRRGGIVSVRSMGKKVLLRGQTITVLRGEVAIP